MESPHVPASSEIRFRTRLHTRGSDEDSHGVLNNAVYPTLFEETRHAMRGSRFPFLLAQANVRYLRPGAGGVDIEVEARTTHLGRSSLTQANRVRDAVGGEAWCEAEARPVFTERLDGGKAPLPDAVRAAIEHFERG